MSKQDWPSAIPDLEPDEVLSMSEPELRNTYLRQNSVLVEPDILLLEHSLGRERERLEDVYETDSGLEKWNKIAEAYLPRCAELIAELEDRKQYVNEPAITLQEELYRRSFQEQFERVRSIQPRLKFESPDDTDLTRFLRNYRSLEKVYREQVKPDLEV